MDQIVLKPGFPNQLTINVVDALGVALPLDAATITAAIEDRQTGIDRVVPTLDETDAATGVIVVTVSAAQVLTMLGQELRFGMVMDLGAGIVKEARVNVIVNSFVPDTVSGASYVLPDLDVTVVDDPNTSVQVSWGSVRTMSGGMAAVTYDPQNIAGDAFARESHTGEQAISTVTGLQTALDEAGGGGIENVVEDTTPQLGGNLDVNGNGITSAAGLPITIGTGAGNDFAINTTGLVYEGDTGRLGIGTAAPSAPLTLDGASNEIRQYGGANYTALSSNGFTLTFTQNGSIKATLNNSGLLNISAISLNGDTHLGRQAAGVFRVGATGAGSDGTLIAGSIGLGHTSPDTRLDVAGAITQRELSADPSDPDEGAFVTWMSNGVGSGDDGDIMVKITAGGVTKTATLIDFSAI